MSQEPSKPQFQQDILDFLGETFERVRGIYLDKGTSLFETLESVTAEEASQRASERSASIAAHVRHVMFYLRVIQRSLRGEEVGKVNWREIWETDQPVLPEVWRGLLQELRAEYASVARMVSDAGTWERPDALGECMAIVTHTAYHLGAMRQALTVIRARAAR